MDVNTLLGHLSFTTPTTVYQLTKVTGLSPTKLVLLLAGCAEVKVEGEGLVRVEVPTPVVEEVKVRKERVSKVLPRIALAKEKMVELIAKHEVVTKDDMLAVAGEDFGYRDIGTAAQELLAAGVIEVEVDGRLRRWRFPVIARS